MYEFLFLSVHLVLSSFIIVHTMIHFSDIKSYLINIILSLLLIPFLINLINIIIIDVVS